MSKLGKYLAEQVLKEDTNINNIIVIYPGRFQPMGRHHAEVYKKLASKFGKANTYIATSDKVTLPKSPLNFKEKYLVMRKHGITNAVQVKNPYQSIEITSKYDPETTAVLFAVGKKDMMESPRFKVGLKKNGEPSYFQYFDKNKNNLQSYAKHGYLIVAPHVELNVPGFGEMSGTTIRQSLATADEATFKDIMGWFDPKLYNLLQSRFAHLKNEQIGKFLSSYNIKEQLSEISTVAGAGKGDVDDGPRYYYGNQKTYRIQTRKMAETLGYSVLNYIIGDDPIEVHPTNFPDGPPLSVSFFPTGVKGAKNAGTDYMRDYKGNQAYKLWQSYVKKIAGRAGYKFIDFLDAEESITSSKSEPLKPDGLREDFNVPINIGDTIMMGKFKNKKVLVKTIGWSNKGDLLINGRSAARFRIVPKEPMKEQALTKDWWKGQLLEVLTETKANTHLTHLEELVLTQGKDGYKKAKLFLLELIKNLKGHSNTKVNTSVKWDGAPAMFVGINPDNGQFFVGTKSVFNKEPKINYTKEDVDINHGHAPGLADKLKKALVYLPSLGIKNILQGDFMFDDSMLKTKSIDGVSHYIFRPNTITYAVAVDSELGKRIGSVKFGIVFHTTYKDLQSGASYGADVSMLKQNSKVWFDDAFFKDATGVVTLTNDEAKQVISNIKIADTIKVDYESLPSALLNVYINSEIRTGKFLDDPIKSFKAFRAWFQVKVDKKVDKLKSEKGKARATAAGQEQMDLFDVQQDNIINVFKVSKLLAESKNIFIQKYNDAVYNTKHFVDDGQGGLKATAPEGYVAVDHIGNGVKLVDRLEFSRANFAMDKGFAK